VHLRQVAARARELLLAGQATAMSGSGRKGSAWDKPTVNAPHKAAIKAVAQSAAAAAGHAHDAELQELLSHVGGLPSGRAAQARKEISKALAAARRGENPLSATLRAPCGPCAKGRTGATHTFLCQTRARQPEQAEKLARDRVVKGLTNVRRAAQLAKVRGLARRPARARAHSPARVTLTRAAERTCKYAASTRDDSN
jgi:hypothetical protein